MKNEKIQVLVTFPKTENMSKRKAVDYVREAVHSHSGAFVPGSPFFAQSKSATVREYKADVSVDELHEEARTRREAYSALCVENDKLKKQVALLNERVTQSSPAVRPDLVVVFNAVVQGINSIDHSSWLPKTHQKREYAKAGGRAVLSRVGASVQQVAQTFLEHMPEPGDADLFYYWIAEAASRPHRLATAIAYCFSPDDYRAALRKLYAEDVAANQTNRIIEDGGLVQG